MSGKNTKRNIPSTEQNQLPALNKPNKKIQLDCFGPITEKNRMFLNLLSIDQLSKWPAPSFCETSDGETAIRFLEQYINFNNIPKIF